MSNQTARYWRQIENGKIQCELCPRRCQLKDGQRGFCFVRAREGNQLVLTTYGRNTGFCVDPIEKKPLNHFLPGTPVLSFGTAGVGSVRTGNPQNRDRCLVDLKRRRPNRSLRQQRRQIVEALPSLTMSPSSGPNT